MSSTPSTGLKHADYNGRSSHTLPNSPGALVCESEKSQLKLVSAPDIKAGTERIFQSISHGDAPTTAALVKDALSD